MHGEAGENSRTEPFGADMLFSAIRRSEAALSASRGLRDCCALLSRREREVKALVVCGLKNRQVGYGLGFNKIAVKADRGKVMRTMQAGSLAELLSMADSPLFPR